jgi:phosphoglycolate phosphatase-like HAD superfamily hydrolase
MKAVILDVDGTLVDSNDAHAHAWVTAFSEAGITVDYDAVRRSIGMGGDKLMPAVSGIDESSPEGSRISKRRGEIFKDTYLPALRALPGARELIQRFLEDDFVLAVASSAAEDELQPLLEAAGVADLIHRRTSSDDADNSKPDPDIVKAALREAGCDPAHSVMIGDTPYDVEAATRSGIEIVALESGGWSADDLAGAIAVYRDPSHLLVEYERSPFARL